MRTAILVIALAFLLHDLSGRRIPRTAAAPVTSATHAASAKVDKVDFDAQIKPILQSKCTPCHFSGGQMYEQLPFDRPETIKKLGTRLFTRIHDESQRQLIRDFLAQE